MRSSKPMPVSSEAFGWEIRGTARPRSGRSSMRVSSIASYIAQGFQQCGRAVTGGTRSARFDRGFFIDPTVFVDVTPDMTIAKEEICGPVVTAQSYENEDDAIRI